LVVQVENGEELELERDLLEGEVEAFKQAVNQGRCEGWAC
jgi:hypothetical protein